MTQKYCAGCSTYFSQELRQHPGTADSFFFNPKGPDIELCVPCSEKEDELFLKTQHNDHPDVVAKYKETMKKNRDL